MAMRGSIQVGIMLGMAFALCACTEAPTSGARLAAGAAVSGEVEAPKTYSRTEPGLWDGRPSLGGVWVAHPGVKSPRRVLIRNTENGKSIAGALFRRERNLPGIPLQVSSDAAEALGMLAGAPAKLSIVALERVDPPEDKAGKPPAGTAAKAAATAPAAKADPAKESVKADAAATKAPPQAKADVAPQATPAKADPAAPKASVKADAAAAKAPPQAKADATPKATPEKADAAAPQAAREAPEKAPAESAAPGHYVQLGLFGVEANARQAAEALARSDTPGELRKQVSGRKTYWSVVAGPVKTSAEQDLLLKKIRGLGYADAYAVRK
ncbi:SPOR domain-containing protein [Paenirhodobacter populi]|uniref:SPOR domain-containing protein n=1 Tax=Paenirhodobacter populi TaxID=2306993 RepID=A0A443JJL6_9RHOB|nr:SPOR domain-containing protein [Sinirhodobacter populi]RWR20775.1 SPOR domain-containing protein [Sinirhodobacter populi]